MGRIRERVRYGEAMTKAKAERKAQHHHYIPIFYLRYFGDGEKPSRVWVHEPGRPPYRKGPRRVAYLPDFYAVDKATGLKKDAIEKNLLGMIESWIPPIIARLQQRAIPSAAEQERLAIFTAFMHTRIPRFKNIVDNAAEQMTKTILQTMAAEPARLDAIRKRNEGETGEHFDVSTQDLLEFIRDESNYRIISPEGHQSWRDAACIHADRRVHTRNDMDVLSCDRERQIHYLRRAGSARRPGECTHLRDGVCASRCRTDLPANA